MKIAFDEIWNFLNLVNKQSGRWKYSLHTNGLIIREIDPLLVTRLRDDDHYDPEILPTIFTYREIMWQPNVYTESKLCLPGLRILKSYCDEMAGTYKEQKGTPVTEIYRKLILGIGGHCATAIREIEKQKHHQVARILGEFRTKTFPIIKFFIYHPMNKADYKVDAVNRLNYAVKVILNDFQGRYAQLEEPYWSVSFNKSQDQIKKASKDKSSQS